MNFKEIFNESKDMKKTVDAFKKKWGSKDEIATAWELHKKELYDAGIISSNELKKWGNPFMNESQNESQNPIIRMLVKTCEGKQTKVKPADYLDLYLNMKDENICEIKVQYGDGKVDVGQSTVYKRVGNYWVMTLDKGKKSNQKVKPSKNGRQVIVQYI